MKRETMRMRESDTDTTRLPKPQPAVDASDDVRSCLGLGVVFFP